MKKSTGLNMLLAMVMVLILVTNPGCGGATTDGTIVVPVLGAQTPGELASAAGNTAALTYLAIEQPTVDTAAQLKVVMDTISTTITSYKDGGFASQAGAISTLLDQKITNPAIKPLADKLVGMLLSELDSQFAKNPAWKTETDKISAIVSHFCSGASAGFATYNTGRGIKEKEMTKPAAKISLSPTL